jgi:heptosyltransferase-2
MRAIAYFSNGLGNFILMMPAFQAVASLTEAKTIDLCLDDRWRDGRRPAIEEIGKRWKMIDKVLSYPSSKIDPRNYDLWFYSPHGSNSDVVTVFLQNRTCRPVPKPSWRNSLMHEKNHYMEIAYALGYQGPFPKVEFPLADDPVLEAKRPVIGLCNGAFNTREWQKKHWPYYQELSIAFKRWFGGTVIGLGGSNELKGVSLDLDFTGKLSITGTAKVLSQCDLLVTTDTGLMHLGWILNVPLIALFGSTLTSKNAPCNARSSILISNLPCAPCQDTARFHSCTDWDYSCMRAITVGDVVAAAKEKFNVNRNYT